MNYTTAVAEVVLSSYQEACKPAPKKPATAVAKSGKKVFVSSDENTQDDGDSELGLSGYRVYRAQVYRVAGCQAFVFAVLGIILFRAAFEYWLVQKYIISDDREVDVGVTQFVKWSMFIVPVTCIFLVGISKSVLCALANFIRLLSLFQSTNDNPLTMVAIGFFVALYHMIARMKWLYHL
ncbi:hypothetical protein Tco_0504718 [Tanacetum coccineum]